MTASLRAALATVCFSSNSGAYTGGRISTSATTIYRQQNYVVPAGQSTFFETLNLREGRDPILSIRPEIAGFSTVSG